MDVSFFFDGWRGLWKTLLVGLLAYILLLFFLRIAGKRTIAKMNVFDFIMVVAIGSTLADTILTPEVSLVEGLAGFIVLIGLQWAISWGTARSRRFEKWVNGQPTLLLYRGEFLRENMKRQRVTEEEVRAAIRMQGLAAVAEAEAVVLETDGVFSVIKSGSRHPPTVMTDVPEFRETL